MLSAIFLLSPMTLTSSVPVSLVFVVAPTGAKEDAPEAPPAIWRSRSAWLILPPGPEPATICRSMLASLALCLTAGLARALVPAARATGAAAATGSGAFSTTGSGLTSSLAGAGSATGSGFVSASSVLAEEFPAPSTSNSIQTSPTGRISPGSPIILVILPSTGDGISTVALSVITESIGSSSLTTSPTDTIHSTTSPSTTPSPISGSLNAYIPIFIPLVFFLLLRQFA